MTDRQILKSAIEKAEKNGWKKSECLSNYLEWEDRNLEGGDFLEEKFYFAIIFSHAFAECFWGEDWQEGDCAVSNLAEIFDPMPLRWQYYLEKMVLEKNALSYLKSFL